MKTTPAQDIQRNVRIYLRANSGVKDVKALALGLAEFIEQQYTADSADEPTFYCPRCGMGGADHTDAPFDCVALGKCDEFRAEAEADSLIRAAEDADDRRGDD